MQRRVPAYCITTITSQLHNVQIHAIHMYGIHLKGGASRSPDEVPLNLKFGRLLFVDRNLSHFKEQRLMQDFLYSERTMDALEQSISSDRLNRYTKSAGTRRAALSLYVWNSAISETLYAALQGLEITMRNSIDVQLALTYGDNWFRNERLFLEPQSERISQAIKKCVLEHPVNRRELVSRMSFGFWSELLYFEMYEELWRKSLYKAFPNRPKGTMRKHVGPIIHGLHLLRNRIAHHEPVFDRALRKDHTNILMLIDWICPVTSTWVSHHSRFNTTFEHRPNTN
jgi:abortive infection bacteriophage resistance protein